MIPSFAIVIEWENARFAELQRTRLMLRSLLAQIRELAPACPTPPQILFMYDKLSIDGNMVNQVLADEFSAPATEVRVSVVPDEGLRYYQQKNQGARMSEGDIVIFLDCDVIPEPGWLRGMLDAFADPQVSVVAGETYIEYSTFYSRAFALFWFFHLRDPAQDLRVGHFFHANNVAFRRTTFERFPFPELPAYRGQCSVLGRQLQAQGIPIHMQMRSRVSHPCPLGVRYFTGRALNNGRDQVIVGKLDSPTGTLPWRSVYWNYASSLGRTWHKFRRDGTSVGLGPIASVFAFGVAVLYFSLKALGEAITLVWPNAVQRLFPI